MIFNDLHEKAQSALDELDEAVLEVFSRTNEPLYPGEVSARLGLPRSLDPDLPYQTIRDSLYRLQADGKLERVIPDTDDSGRRKWQFTGAEKQE
ncbi:MAG: hypothetical protein OXH00_16855 [Candidatus Poribacteria bacterium]|nr:hypothetical protein [Candidatus Poribacteria bacterium]